MKKRKTKKIVDKWNGIFSSKRELRRAIKGLKIKPEVKQKFRVEEYKNRKVYDSGIRHVTWLL